MTQTACTHNNIIYSNRWTDICFQCNRARSFNSVSLSITDKYVEPFRDVYVQSAPCDRDRPHTHTYSQYLCEHAVVGFCFRFVLCALASLSLNAVALPFWKLFSLFPHNLNRFVICLFIDATRILCIREQIKMANTC